MQIKSPTNHNALIKFGIKFTLVSGVLYILFNWLPASLVANPLNRQTAEMTAFLLRLIGLKPSVSGALVSAQEFTAKIIPECTAIFMAILFFSFIVAYPTALRHKVIGLLFGLSFLFAANLLRVFFVFLVGIQYRAFFEYAHVYIGQLLMILLVLLTSMIWLRSTAAAKMDDRPLSFFIRFIGYSSIPFVIWLYLDQAFVFANLFIIKSLLGFFGFQVLIPDKLHLYPHTFHTFHLMAFTSLILATKSIDRGKKIRSLVIGLSILCGAHFLFRLHEVLFLHFQIRYAFRPFIALIIINQWILPFGLWLFMVRNELFKHKDRHICPICGEEKAGLIDHIKAKHGEKPLQDPKIRLMLNNL